MGLFSRFKDTCKKSEAAVVVQNLLEDQAKLGFFDLNPAEFANKLIEIVWDAKPHIFNGKLAPRPHKITVAASALAKGIDLFKDDDFNKSALVLSLGNILCEIEKNGNRYPLKSVDHQLLEISLSVYIKITEKVT
jgi:hypothetical protein